MDFKQIKQVMRSVMLIAPILISAVALTACQQVTSMVKPAQAGTETEVTTLGPVAECQGKLKASIAISRFDNKAPRMASFYSFDLGDGMADQLTTALVTTGCYRVVDRQNLKGVMDEMNLQNSGLVDKSTASRIGKLVGADLIVTAAITEFQDNSSGSGGSIGGGGGTGVVGAAVSLLNAQKKAHMAVDLRITDVQTSEIISVTAVKGTATDVKFGAALSAFFPAAAGLGALESWENTPRGAALRQVIEKSVSAIYRSIPEGYFRHQVGRRFNKAPADGGGSSGKSMVRKAQDGGGSAGNSMVRKAQQVLSELGLYTGAVDGLTGPRTTAAIKAFQSQMELDVTGKLDIATMQAIRGLTE